MISNSDFAAWLQHELDKREWIQRELVRQARSQGIKITPSQLSRILKREQDGTVEVIMGIASGLNLPHEEVFRARGWLPSEIEKTNGLQIDPRAEKLAIEISSLPIESRQAALDVIEPLIAYIRNTEKSK